MLIKQNILLQCMDNLIIHIFGPKEIDKKKLEEEKKRIRREKIMLEKASRDRKTNFDQRAQEEIEELQAKVSQL